MYCTKCGNMISETSKFCPKCGAAVQVAALPQPQQLRSANAVQVKNHNKMIGILFIVGVLVVAVLLIAVIFHLSPEPKPNPNICTHCNGTGIVTCTTCNGTGKWETKIVLPGLYDEHYQPKDCLYCVDGKKDCPYCGGDGEI